MTEETEYRYFYIKTTSSLASVATIEKQLHRFVMERYQNAEFRYFWQATLLPEFETVVVKVPYYVSSLLEDFYNDHRELFTRFISMDRAYAPLMEMVIALSGETEHLRESNRGHDEQVDKLNKVIRRLDNDKHQAIVEKQDLEKKNKHLIESVEVYKSYNMNLLAIIDRLPSAPVALAVIAASLLALFAVLSANVGLMVVAAIIGILALGWSGLRLFGTKR
jgi:hypothetical protein